MLFNSWNFLLFFPIVTVIYFIMPKKLKNYWLLICSYFFYMCWNVVYALLLFASTFITFRSGIEIDKAKQKENDNEKARSIVALSFLLNLSILAVFKYTGFVIETLNSIFSFAKLTFVIPEPSILLPVGISFYIFQALSYTMDVYRGDVSVEKSLPKYMLFVSFFPQLVAGPIERSSRLLKQFDEEHKFDYDRVCRGLMLMVWGYFEKVVIADRLAVLVNHVFSYGSYYQGLHIFIGAAFFAFEVYCDFAGYTHIAKGAAQVLGFDLMDNFRQPYFATSVTDFWKRWHISLTSWFRDYLYIPLGGNRKGKLIKYRNILIVFLLSGLWHGAGLTYIVWGGLNGVFQILEAQTLDFRNKIKSVLKIRQESFSNKMLSTIITFILVDITWIFFKSDSISKALTMIKNLFSGWKLYNFVDGSLYNLGLSKLDFGLAIISILILLFVDILHEKKFAIREWVLSQNIVFRWSLYIGAVMIILIFGFYGPNYDAAQFIYFQF